MSLPVCQKCSRPVGNDSVVLKNGLHCCPTCYQRYIMPSQYGTSPGIRIGSGAVFAVALLVACGWGVWKGLDWLREEEKREQAAQLEQRKFEEEARARREAEEKARREKRTREREARIQARKDRAEAKHKRAEAERAALQAELEQAEKERKNREAKRAEAENLRRKQEAEQLIAARMDLQDMPPKLDEAKGRRDAAQRKVATLESRLSAAERTQAFAIKQANLLLDQILKRSNLDQPAQRNPNDPWSTYDETVAQMKKLGGKPTGDERRQMEETRRLHGEAASQIERYGSLKREADKMRVEAVKECSDLADRIERARSLLRKSGSRM